MSLRETYAAWKVQIENWRWAGVPFYLRAGKRLAEARHGDRDPVQDPADRALPAGRRPAAGAERPRPQDPARRGHRAEVRREGARARR